MSPAVSVGGDNTITALFGDEPIIVATEMPATGTRTVLFWHEIPHPVVAGTYWEDSVIIEHHPPLAATLRVKPTCPDGWLPVVWAAFLEVRAGRMPQGSHTVEWVSDSAWSRNRPVFTEVTA